MVRATHSVPKHGGSSRHSLRRILTSGTRRCYTARLAEWEDATDSLPELPGSVPHRWLDGGHRGVMRESVSPHALLPMHAQASSLLPDWSIHALVVADRLALAVLGTP